jgi:hypothetical protein
MNVLRDEDAHGYDSWPLLIDFDARRLTMTIDQRLERLTERHEALTMSVELLTRDLHALGGIVSKIAEGTAALARVAESHNLRLNRLEGGA